MILKNLWRRKARTILTLTGIAIGVAAIVALGALAQGLRAGFTSMSRGSQADLVLSQADVMAAFVSSIDEAVGDEIGTWPEVDAVDGVFMSNAMLGDFSYLFLFGYEPEGFSVAHVRIIEGEGLAQARGTRGRPILLGRRAAESMDQGVGDTVHITGSAFRVVGIYETGDGFEDSGAVASLQDVQALALQPRRVSMFYVQLRDPSEIEQVRARVERRFPDLSVSTTAGFVDQQQMIEILEAVAMVIAGLAVVIGGVGMTNTLFMSVFERTREIGVLRALGWRRRQVLALILGESLALSLLGGLLGIALGILASLSLSQGASWLSVFGTRFSSDLLLRALVTVVVLGLVGGAYPAWWASRLLPLEALRYEGGAASRTTRVIPGGWTMRNLWRRRTRTALTLVSIGISIAAVIALGGIAEGMLRTFNVLMTDSQTDLLAVEAGIDVDFSAIDERVGSRLAARPEVEAVSGMIMTAVSSDRMPMTLLFGYHPREFAIRRLRIIDGEPLTTRRQVLVGRNAAEQMGLEVGDTLRLFDSSFRVVGIYETGQAFEDIGVVVSLREAQALVGKPHQVQFYAINLYEPERAEEIRAELGAVFPEIDLALTSDLTETISDFRILEELVGQVSFLAVLIGLLGMMNTMLMSVLERTREIGVLRALGWRRRRVLGLILQESLVLGLAGGICGIALGLVLAGLASRIPGIFGAMKPLYTPQLFAQAMVVALAAGAVGGLYPAWRATRMRPVEALRYE